MPVHERGEGEEEGQLPGTFVPLSPCILVCFKAVHSDPLGGGADSVADSVDTQEHAPADNNLPLKGAPYVQSIGDVGGGGGGLSIQKLVCNQPQCTQLDTHLHLHYQQPLRQNS